MKIFQLILVLLLVLSSQAAPNPWLNDPLAKLNLFPNSFEKKPNKANIPLEQCLMPPTCSLCEVIEEWPIDFDGDDLAEKAQRRQCPLKPDSNIGEEIIIIYSSSGIPSIYKSNLMNCNKDKWITYDRFERLDFNKDNLDELIIVEHDQKTKSDDVKILGFNRNKALIEEMPLIEYQTDLKDKYKGNLETLQKHFIKSNGSGGFILSLLGNSQEFRVYYYQDASDRAFYPLHLIEMKKKSLTPIYQTKSSLKSANATVEVIE